MEGINLKSACILLILLLSENITKEIWKDGVMFGFLVEFAVRHVRESLKKAPFFNVDQLFMGFFLFYLLTPRSLF